MRLVDQAAAPPLESELLGRRERRLLREVDRHVGHDAVVAEEERAVVPVPEHVDALPDVSERVVGVDERVVLPGREPRGCRRLQTTVATVSEGVLRRRAPVATLQQVSDGVVREVSEVDQGRAGGPVHGLDGLQSMIDRIADAGLFEDPVGEVDRPGMSGREKARRPIVLPSARRRGAVHNLDVAPVVVVDLDGLSSVEGLPDRSAVRRVLALDAEHRRPSREQSAVVGPVPEAVVAEERRPRFVDHLGEPTVEVRRAWVRRGRRPVVGVLDPLVRSFVPGSTDELERTPSSRSSEDIHVDRAASFVRHRFGFGALLRPERAGEVVFVAEESDVRIPHEQLVAARVVADVGPDGHDVTAPRLPRGIDP